jgi:hypothetical protein
MSGPSDPRWDDPRDRDDESRDVEVHWVELERALASDRQPEVTPATVTTDAIALASTIRASVVTTLVMYFWTVLSCRAASIGSSSWTAITATRSMARRAGRSPQRVRSGSCPKGTCATLVMGHLMPATTLCVICETRGSFGLCPSMDASALSP